MSVVDDPRKQARYGQDVINDLDIEKFDITQ